MSFEIDRARHIGGVDQAAWGGMSPVTFTTKVMPLFGLALAVMAAGALGGFQLFAVGSALAWPVTIGSVIATLVLALSSPWWQRKEGVNKLLFFAYAVLSGVTIVPLLIYVGRADGILVIAQALGVTTVTFFGLAAYGATTKRDFANMGGFIFIAMLGLLVAGLANIFFQSSMLSLVCAVGGVGIFSAFAVWEMNMIRNTYDDADYVGASLGLFIAFMGLFTSILRLFGIGVGRDD